MTTKTFWQKKLILCILLLVSIVLFFGCEYQHYTSGYIPNIGEVTINGLDAYDGLYAFFNGAYWIYGFASWSASETSQSFNLTLTGVQVVNGTVTLPMWEYDNSKDKLKEKTMGFTKVGDAIVYFHTVNKKGMYNLNDITKRIVIPSVIQFRDGKAEFTWKP